MPIFRYEAVDKTGKTVRGAMDAPTEQVVAQKLATMGYRPQTILRPGASANPQAPPQGNGGGRPAKMDRPKPASSSHPVSVETSVPLKDLAFFYRQLAAYIRSGLTPYQAFTDLQSCTRNGKIRRVLVSMAERVKSGGSLSSAMAEFPGIFPVHATALVWNGELGGYVDKAVDEVASSMEEEVRENRYGRFGWMLFKISLISFILTIPAIDLKSLFLNGVEALGTKKQPSLPNLDNLEEIASSGSAALEMGEKLSGGINPMDMVNAVLKGYVNTVLHVYLPIIIALLAFWVLWAKLKRVPSFKRILDSVILSIPIWGPLQRERARARFARSLGMLSRSGIAPAAAWDAACLTVRNSVISERLRSCSPILRQNATMQDAFARCGVYAHEDAAMVGTGEKTGQLSDMTDRLADYHDNNAAHLKSQARMWAIHGLIVSGLLMMGYTMIQTVRTYLALQTEVLPKILGIPGL